MFVATVLSPSSCPLFQRGKCCPFFSLCVFWGLVRCLLSSFCRSSLLRVVVRKIFGSELLFWGVGVCCVCVCVLVLFCLCLCFSFGFFVPETVFKKFSCCQVWCFWVVVFLPLVVSPSSSFFLFFLRETAQVVTGHTPTRTLCSFSFFLSLSPAAFVCSPVLAVRPFLLVFFRGAILGPGRFLDSLGTSLRPVSWTRGGKGVSLLLVLVLFFPFSFCFAAFFTRARRGRPVIVRGVPPGHRACPSPE